MACLDEQAVARRLAGQLDARTLAAQEEHIAACSSCRDWVAAVARLRSGSTDTSTQDGARRRGPAEAPHTVGSVIGRYVVLEVLGRGGMGEVFAAYDPELDRRVALKLLRPERTDAPGATGRLLREARAMARLTTPHVVTVHDVGTVDDEVFIAMEFVPGTTLRAWVEADSRDFRRVVEVFVRAGKGLAVAHAAGIVHRDFKPDNVLVVEHDGRLQRVCVVDFGLAHALGGTTPAASVLDTTDVLDETLTRTGACVGTPAYLAPEQYRGQPPDPASDQFSFCVALYEALYGERPFSGATLDAIQLAVADGEVRPPPTDSAVPSRLRAVVVRGLAADPAMRWPSMTALLDGLGAVSQRRRWVPLAGAAAATLSLVGAAAVARGEQPCSGSQARVDAVWSAGDRQAVVAALGSTKVGAATGLAQRVEAALDARAAAWVDAHRDACLAHQVRGEQSAAMMDRRMACLARCLSELEAHVELLAHADEPTARRAMAATLRLPDVAPCSDVAYLTARVAPPVDAETAGAVAAIDDQLARARVLERAGRLHAALALSRAAEAGAHGLDYPPVLAAAELAVGKYLEGAGQYAQAEALLQSAVLRARAAGDDETAAWAGKQLAFVVGSAQARYDEGELWGRQALADVERGRLRSGLRAGVLESLGGIARARGELDSARSYFEQALAAIDAEPERPDHDLERGFTLHGLGNVANDQGRLDEALAAYEEVREVWSAALGARHPDLAGVVGNIAAVRAQQGALDEAAALFEDSLAVRREVLGPDHPDVELALRNLGQVRWDQHRYAEAQSLLEEALELGRRVHGDDHPSVSDTLDALAGLHAERGELEEALQLCQRALAGLEASLGAEHPQTARVRFNVAGLHARRGELESAESLGAQAAADLLDAYGPHDPRVGSAHATLAELQMQRDRPGRAQKSFTIAMTAFETAFGPDHEATAKARAGLETAREAANLTD